MLSQDFLLKILNKSEHGIHIVSSTGFTLFYNESAERIDGISSQHIVGKHLQDLIDQGIFSKSVALNVIESKKTEEIVQLVNNKLIIATGIPIFESEILEAVVVFTKDTQLLENLTCQLQALVLENEKMADNLSKYEAKYLRKDTLIANSKAMKRILKMVDRLASKLDSPIFIQGEAGTGKTMFAEYLHSISPRCEKPMFTLDCSAIPNSIIQKELFGAIDLDGPNTFSDDSLLAKAQGGTLFLDEIADMPLSCQGRLVHILNLYQYNTSSTSMDPSLDIQIISASNENLREKIRDGSFREDLYYRLNIIPIKIPPLRERQEDIAPLVQLFLKKYNNYYQENKKLSPKAQKILINYTWPGNVSELKNIMERLVVTSEYGILTAENVEDLTSSITLPLEENNNFKELVENYEKKLILEYAKNSSSIKELALLARIKESTLRKKISRYNINITF